MNHYRYEGAVKEFDTIIRPHWVAETHAPSEKKALSNLAFQYKKETHRARNCKIVLPGKITVVK